MSKLVTAEKFYELNPLWELLTPLGEASGYSYKSHNVDANIQCKECGEQTTRKGTAGYKCNRCRRNVGVEDGVFTIVEPEGEKELDAQRKGLARNPKTIVLPAQAAAPVAAPAVVPAEVPAVVPAEAPVVVPAKEHKRNKVKPVPPPPSSDSEEEEDPPAKKGVFMDLNVLAKAAAKASGYESAAEAAITAKNVEQRKERLKKKTAQSVQRDAEEERNIDEPVAPVKKVMTKEEEKKAPCSGLVTRELVLKSGDTYFLAELGLMIRVE